MAVKYDMPPQHPDRLHIQTISYCNARCRFCAYPAVKERISHGIMPDSVYHKIIDEASGYNPKRISLLLMNEPLLDRKLPERIAYAKKRLHDTEITITTNGSILTPAIIGRLVDSGLDRIKISIQGLTREAYEEVMGLDYQRTMDGVHRLIDTVRKSGGHKPRIVLSMVVIGQNESEHRKYKRYWRRLGVKATSVAFENKGGNIESDPALHPYGLKAFRRCYRFNRCAYVLYNGDMILCCADWSRSVVLGNVQDKPLLDIWHSDKLNAIREDFRNGTHETLPHICRSCKRTRLSQRSHRNLRGMYHKIRSCFQSPVS